VPLWFAVTTTSWRLGLDGVQARELGPVVHEAQVPVDRLQRHVQVPAADQRPEVLADVAEALQL